MLSDIPEYGVTNPFARRSEEDTHRVRHHRKPPVDESRQDAWIDRARQGVHCSLFCSGRKCRFERWSSLSPEVQASAAIEGLNSNWVGDNVIASQRPSTSLFLKYLLIQQFKEKQVTGVLNLQEKGEHRSCGPDGIYESCGFSYSGVDDLMPNGVYYYEFPWPDMTAPEQDVVLRSVQLMDYHIQRKGKVLVHCHAGLGRTGLMIACYYVYSHHMSSADAIQLVRDQRPGAIQTEKQFRFICAFEKHIWRLSQAFYVEISDARINVELFIRRQRCILHGALPDLLRYTPVFLHSLLCRLINLTEGNSEASQLALLSFGSSASPPLDLLNQYKVLINRRQYAAKNESSVRVLSFLVGDWFRSMSSPALSAENCDAMIAFQRRRGNTEEDAVTLVDFILSRPVAHTLGMVISAVERIARCSFRSRIIHRQAYRSLVDSFDHEFNPVKLRYAPIERDLLYDFFMLWGRIIGDAYFNADHHHHHRAVHRIAMASKEILGETKIIHQTDFTTPSLLLTKPPTLTASEEKKQKIRHIDVLKSFFLDTEQKTRR